MKINLSRTLCAVFVTLFIASALFAQESLALRYKFGKGKSLRFNTLLDGAFTQSAMGSEMTVTTSGHMYIHLTDEGSNEKDLASLIMIIDSGKVSVKMPAKETTSDLNNFADKRIRFLIDPAGKVIKREILDSVSAEKDAFAASYRQAFHYFPALPGKAVKMNDKWDSVENDTADVMGGRVANNSTYQYTLAGREKVSGIDCLKITFTGESKNQGNTSMMGMEFNISGTGKTTGTFYFDPVKGNLVSNEYLTELDLVVRTSGENGMSIPIKQTIKAAVNAIYN